MEERGLLDVSVTSNLQRPSRCSYSRFIRSFRSTSSQSPPVVSTSSTRRKNNLLCRAYESISWVQNSVLAAWVVGFGCCLLRMNYQFYQQINSLNLCIIREEWRIRVYRRQQIALRTEMSGLVYRRHGRTYLMVLGVFGEPCQVALGRAPLTFKLTMTHAWY